MIYEYAYIGNNVSDKLIGNETWHDGEDLSPVYKLIVWKIGLKSI